jgi:hypothetical protein
MMVAILGALRAASASLGFSEIAIGIYGGRTATRIRRGRRRKVVVPAGDTANLRRALRGLVRRGDIVVVSDDALPECAGRPHGTRYTVSDPSTGNEKWPANDVTSSALPPEPVVDCGLPAKDVVLDRSEATSVVGVLADRTLPAPDNGGAAPRTRRAHSGSGESSGSSVRLTPTGGVPISVRGELPIPARVFAWERGLLSTLVDDLLQDLSHAANENDDPNP